jgi:outer membrane protein, heavy metal efflux system
MSARVVRLVLLAALLVPGAGAAGADDLLRAVAASPAVAAAARRADAAAARVDGTGLLPDPEAEGMVSRMNGPMGERTTMAELTLRQPLPRRGERAARSGFARAVAETARTEITVVSAEVAAEVAAALAEADAARARAELAEARRTRLAPALAALEARLAAGGGSRLAERLALQSRVDALELEAAESRRVEADAHAAARGRLGLAPEAGLPAFAAPEPADILPEEVAARRRAVAMMAEAVAMGRLARAEAEPMASVGVRYERADTTMGNEDTVGLALMTDLPWRSRRTSRAEVRAAESTRAAAAEETRAVARQLETDLARVGRADRQAAAARRTADDTRRRLGAEADALVRAASAGRGGESTVLLLVELLDRSAEADLRALDAELAARLARAGLWRHAPADRFPVPASP